MIDCFAAANEVVGNKDCMEWESNFNYFYSFIIHNKPFSIDHKPFSFLYMKDSGKKSKVNKKSEYKILYAKLLFFQY